MTPPTRRQRWRDRTQYRRTTALLAVAVAVLLGGVLGQRIQQRAKGHAVALEGRNGFVEQLGCLFRLASFGHHSPCPVCG